MAKASSTLPASASRAITAVADEIHALINSRVRSPSKDDLAAIIAKMALPAPDVSAPALRAEWEALRLDVL